MREPQRLAFGPFWLDLHDERLWRGHEVVRVLPKPFAVLRCLATQAGQLVTKDALLEAVWPETVVSEDVITVAIRQLRRALGDQARLPQFIETVHGRGYRFIAPVVVAALFPERPRTGEGRQLPGSTRVPPRLFVGREAALVRMQQWWATALQGQRQIGFIAGEPGLGKTALVDVFTAQVVAAEDVWVAYGQCIDQYGTGEAYLPLLEALGRLGQGPDGGEVVALLRQYAPSWLVHLPALLTPANRAALLRTTSSVTSARMLRELAEALEVLTATRPLVLVLEDLHWSDHATLAWLAYVARRRDPAHMLVLGTYRPVEVIVEGHPLRRMITELRHHGQCKDMALDYLSEAAVTAYLGQRFGATMLQASLAQALHRHTHGNPLFLLAVVDELVAQHLLQNADEGWRLHGGHDTVTGIVPESLRQLIEQQIEQLSPDEQALLEAASVTGSTFTAAAVAAGVAQQEETIDGHCTTWARQGRFVHAAGTETWPDGTVTACYSFLHALYHEVVYRRVSAGQRARLHRRIGLRTEGGYGAQAPTMATVLAVHFTRAQDQHRAVQYLRHAAENAVHRAAYQEAVACLEQALEALTGLPDSRATREQAIDLRLDLRPPLWQLGKLQPLLKRLREADTLAAALDDHPRQGRILVYLSRNYAVLSDHQQAVDCAQRSLAIATALTDRRLTSSAHICLGHAYISTGDYRQAADCARQSMATLQGDLLSARLSGNSLSSVTARWIVGLALAELGEFAEGSACGQDAVMVAESTGNLTTLLHAYHCLGVVALRQGDLQQAVGVLGRGLVLCQTHDIPLWFPVFAADLGSAYARSGQIGEALPLLEQAQQQMVSLEFVAQRAGRMTQLGEAYLLAGRLEDAQAKAVQALEGTRARQEHGDEAWALRLCGEVYARCDPTQTALALSAYHQALAQAETLGMRPLQAHCHRSLGMLYATTGQRQQARLALATALALYRSMQMAFWLPETEAALAQVAGR